MGVSALRYMDSGWRQRYVDAIAAMLASDEMKACISEDHVYTTPERSLIAFDEYFRGIYLHPEELLEKALFPSKGYSQMIHVGGQQFYSTCAHHLAPFFGRMHFAYIPDNHIIGLSKIPRLMEIYARRPQVQEQLTEDIVNAFYDIVKPVGCALLIRATHFCMEARGIRAHGCETTTTALRGVFTSSKVKDEFLMAANRLEWRV